ncbi:MAG: UDP-N-acetylmuramoyl-tripeptide--D-alanyl-D-alanine ligase [Rubrivivax sp.]|nr:UDP-N-acetylmuramoyl-tripeptide--D-alanyl-D-alanine ligase [Rubrivivax sp.]
MMTLAQAHALLPGSTLVGDAALVFERVHTDTRTLQAGDLFVALQGDRFDGNDFLSQAQAQGAVAALAMRGLGAAMPGLLVPDPLAALQQLAAAWRARFHLPLIAVTGSNGKTTVTQIVAAILWAWQQEHSLATAGNLNNHIGVPLMLLRLRQDDGCVHRVAVLELGMNHPGEIARLARWAAPTVALVNNAQREHQEFMAGVDAVARENGAVIAALGAGGTAVFPADDPYTLLWRGMAGSRRVVTFGAGGDVSCDAQWSGTALHWQLALQTPAGAVTTVLALPGEHNVRNAMAAAACALAAGAPLRAIETGMAAFRPVAGRSHVVRLRWRGRDVTLIDDSYNANPDSVLAAIELLAGLPGPRWLILGDMGEVGVQGPQFHAEVGARAHQRGIEQVWAVGALSVHTAAHRHFVDISALLAALHHAYAQAPAAASVLVKGSRFMKMEQVVQALQKEAADAV